MSARLGGQLPLHAAVVSLKVEARMRRMHGLRRVRRMRRVRRVRCLRCLYSTHRVHGVIRVGVGWVRVWEPRMVRQVRRMRRQSLILREHLSLCERLSMGKLGRRLLCVR